MRTKFYIGPELELMLLYSRTIICDSITFDTGGEAFPPGEGAESGFGDL